MNLLLSDNEVPVVFGDLVSDIYQGTLNPADPIVQGVLMPSSWNDLDFKAGQFSVTGNLQQRINCRLKTIQGEWWLDGTIGVPYFTEVFKKSPDLAVLRQAFLTVIQGVPGVEHVDDLKLNFDKKTRTLEIIFYARGKADSASGNTMVSL